MFPWWVHALFWVMIFAGWILFALKFKAARDASKMQIHSLPVKGISKAEQRRKQTFGSPIEKLLYDAIVKAGLPTPELQYDVIEKGRLVTIPDLAYPLAKIAIFCDGHQWHSSEDKRTSDKKKRDYLKAKGWTVLIFSGSAINTTPGDCVKEVKRAIITKR